MDTPNRQRCWYPAFVIYRWRHVMWLLPSLALIGLLVLHWNRLRWDHAMAVVQLRPAGACTLSGPLPALPVHPGKMSFETISPEVLRKAVRYTGLAAAWQMYEGDAALRLRSSVNCDYVPGTATIEVKVRKLPSADCLKVCEAILQHAHEEAEAEQRAVKTEELRRSKAEEEKAWAEFRAVSEELRAWDRSNPPEASAPKELVDSFYAKQSLAQQIRLKVISDESDLRILKAPAATIMAPHWPNRPAQHHLKHFGISAAWTFGVSVLIAIAMAYLLEAMIPRKKAQEALLS